MGVYHKGGGSTLADFLRQLSELADGSHPILNEKKKAPAKSRKVQPNPEHQRAQEEPQTQPKQAAVKKQPVKKAKKKQPPQPSKPVAKDGRNRYTKFLNGKRQNLKDAVILSEIIGPPKAFQDF